MTRQITIKESQLPAFLNYLGWEFSQNWQISDTRDYGDHEAVGGWVSSDSRCVYNGVPIRVSYNQVFGYKKHDKESLKVSDDPDEILRIEGLVVVDNDDESYQIPPWELFDAFKRADFCEIGNAVAEIRAQIEETEELNDNDGDETMTIDLSDKELEEITLDNDNAPNIKFTGYQIATVSSEESRGEPGRWTVLNLFVTKGGKYVCQEIGRTRWEHERTKYTVKVCANLEEVKEFFGHKWLAKQLYECAGIENAITIE